MIALAGAEAEPAWLAEVSAVLPDAEEHTWAGAEHDYAVAMDLASYGAGLSPRIRKPTSSGCADGSLTRCVTAYSGRSLRR
jgi:hypothetical protein